MTVFLDANVAMYLVGAPHRHRARAAEVIDELVLAGVRSVTDAEVYQQILHRYSSLQRLDMISPAYAVLDGLADEIYTVGRSDLDEARRLVLDGAGAGDAIHVATMRAHGVTRILTFHRGFDRFADLERLA